MAKAPSAGSARILFAEDEAALRENLAAELADEGYRVRSVADGTEAIAALDAEEFDLILTDLRMPGADGLEVLAHARSVAPGAVAILITAHATVETAILALKSGAQDYLLKPIVIEDVLGKIARLLEHRDVARENQLLRGEVERQWIFEDLVGDAPAMQELIQIVRKVAETDRTILITGESGVGKEVVARAIHRLSPLGKKLFLPVNCGAIPESLLESQLFGHVRGAFTGATTSQEGLFQRAGGGTIFLDEIGDMPLNLQVKLLRAVEHKEILPLGATTPVTVDVRILAATNRDLRKAVDGGEFREDLYYRLNVVNVQIPPLRERREDIPKLAAHFVAKLNREMKKRVKGLDEDALRVLLAQPWPGNVRELENVIERAMILGDGASITVADLPASLRSGSDAGSGEALKSALRAFERAHIESALAKHGDKKATADALGISVSSLYPKIEDFGI